MTQEFCAFTQSLPIGIEFILGILVALALIVIFGPYKARIVAAIYYVWRFIRGNKR